MSPTLSPAIVARVSGLTDELNDLSEAVLFLINFFDSGMACNIVEAMHDELERSLHGLGACLTGSAPGKAEVDPAYILPASLHELSTIAAEAAPVLVALGSTKGQPVRLAVDYAASRLNTLGASARFIGETVLEELPPLASPPVKPDTMTMGEEAKPAQAERRQTCTL